MSHPAPRIPSRTLRRLVAVLFLVNVVLLGIAVFQSAAWATRPLGAAPGERLDALPSPDGAVTEADGAMPEGVGAFDDRYPGIANLDAALRQALRDATADASADGLSLEVTSGWRSPEYQEQLLREAVAEYGSADEAARWVATAETSAHVSGTAVDVGPVDGWLWLSQHGFEYGLCQVYGNEPWHFELRPEAVDGGCPAGYADPTEDPRMQP
ncbi:peptidase M15 [Agromyces sp. CFH 90414]|uniref:Peptidase M15 n=1 Tax=Agromyces agglutinans TaxID=2662258 RepID=A0A6I2F9B6_9MICO|nr:M15 family metallopeptidase [Agromyces agglutinans]MRG60834.1 peptidase M15 [Agromyces agglutinans]